MTLPEKTLKFVVANPEDKGNWYVSLENSKEYLMINNEEKEYERHKEMEDIEKTKENQSKIANNYVDKKSLMEKDNYINSKLSTLDRKGKNFKEFIKLIDQPQTEKLENVLKLFENYIPNKDGIYIAMNNYDYLVQLFESMDCIFAGLSDEFQVAGLQKILKIFNDKIQTHYTDSDGKFGAVYFNGTYHTVKPFALNLIEKFQQNFLFNPYYKSKWEDVKQNMTPEDSKALVQTVLLNLPIEISQRWIDSIWKKEEHSLTYISLPELASKNNQATSYLLKNFSGWNQKDAIVTFFKEAYLGQNNIDQLLKNVGKIKIQASDEIAQTILKRKDISDMAKIKIFQEFFPDLSKNQEVFEFMMKHLQSSSVGKEIFEGNPFNLSEAIKNNIVFFLENGQDYLDNGTFTLSDYETFKNKDYANVLPGLISQISSKKIVKQDWLNSCLSKEDKTEIFKNLSHGSLKESNIKNTFFKLYELWKDDIDQEDILKNHFEILNSTSNINALLEQYTEIFKIETDEKRKKEYFNLAYKKCHGFHNYFLSTEDKHFMHNEIIKNGKGWDFLFDSLKGGNFNEYGYSGFQSMFSFIDEYMQVLVQNKPDIVFDLRKEHPIQKWIKSTFELIPENQNAFRKDIFLNCLNKLANKIFERKLNDYPAEKGDDLKDIFVNLKNQYVPEMDFKIGFLSEFDKRENKKTSLFKFWDRKKEHLNNSIFLVIKNQQLKFEDVLIEENEIENTDSDFITKAKSEMKQIKDFLADVTKKQKPYSLDIKIKVENIMLDYFSFISVVSEARDLIANEDMHFLKNNLNVYLLESLRVYDKALTRYEVMNKANESGNLKKMFSGKSEEEIENYKQKIDNECMRQITLLEKQLELVKSNVLENLKDESLMDLKSRTKFYSDKFTGVSLSNESSVSNMVKVM